MLTADGGAGHRLDACCSIIILAWNEAFWTLNLTTLERGAAHRLHRVLFEPGRAVLGQALGGLDAGDRAHPRPRLVQPEAARARPDLRRGEITGRLHDHGSDHARRTSQKSFGAVHIINGVDLDDRGRLVRRLRRAVGLRQVHAAAADRRARGRHRRQDPDRRQRRGRRAAGQARPLDGVPVLRALSAHERARQHRLRPEDGGPAQGRDRPQGRGRGGDPQPHALSRPQAARTLRRPAPARRDRPRHRARAEGVPVRRAAVQPRRGACACRCGIEITRLQKQLGTTAIYVTHDQVEAMTMADKIVVLNAGKIEQVRLAARALRAAGQSVRRRLHRLAEDELRRR